MKKVFSCCALAIVGVACVYVSSSQAAMAETEIGLNYNITTIGLNGGSAPTIVWDGAQTGYYQFQVGDFYSSSNFDPTGSIAIGNIVDNNVASMSIAKDRARLSYESISLTDYAYLYMQINKSFHVVGSGVLLFSTDAIVQYGFDDLWGASYAGLNVNQQNSGSDSSSYSNIRANTENNLNSGSPNVAIVVEDGGVYYTSIYSSIGTSPNPAPVPIPGAALLLGSGILGLVGFGRKKTS